MNESEIKRFDEIYRKFEAGLRDKALQELRDLAGGISDDVLAQIGMLYHETLFLAEMDRISEARAKLEELKRQSDIHVQVPADREYDDLRTNFAVMVRYTEMKVLLKEKRESEALVVVEDLVSRYPKQLSLPGFQDTFNEIETYRGFLLADAERWAEARPLLEEMSPPEKWRGIQHYYLGYYYYLQGNYRLAESKLTQAFNLDLTGLWKSRAHYILGIVKYRLSNVKESKYEFESSVKTGDPHDLPAKIWQWLEVTSLALGEYSEAEKYKRRGATSKPDSKPN